MLLYVPRCPGRGRGECGRGSVGDVVVRIRLFLLLVRQLERKRESHANISYPCLCTAQEYVHTVAACIGAGEADVQMHGSLQEHNSDKENLISSVIHPCLPPLSQDKK